MHTSRFTSIGGVAALAIWAATGFSGLAARENPGSRDASDAARAFLRSLPAELRAQAQFPFDSAERFDWHYVPQARKGVSLLMLDDAQAEHLGPLLATALSPEGLLSARGIMKHENILRRVETASGIDASRRDPGLYYTTIFGAPSTAKPWGWRFEGHHLSLNVTELPGRPPAVGPVFMGANPARVPSGPNEGFRLMAAEEDLGRALMTLLPPDRRSLALIRDIAFPEILTGNDREVRLAAAGLPAGSMSTTEQRQLRDLIELYAHRLTPAAAQDFLARLDRAGFERLRFAWAGSLEPGQPHYYRVHGPTLLIEYDNTQNQANHVHTVFRDLERDFGGDALREHYRHPASHP